MTTVSKGQALIIILVVMSISLVLGVAVSSRAISTLRQISFSDQAATALAFAEGGAEDGLKYIKDGNCGVPCNYDPLEFDLDGDGTNDFDYRITPLGDSKVFDLPPIERDRTVEVNLSGYSRNAAVYVHWVDESNDDEVADPPAVEMTIIYCEDNDPNCTTRNYGIVREAVDPTVGRSSSGFYPPPSKLDFFYNGVTYVYRDSITPPSGKYPVLLRIKFLYSKGSTSLAVEAASGALLPIQGSRIESWGFSGRTVRKVEVTRTANALAELFDYVLFSGSELIPLSK